MADIVGRTGAVPPAHIEEAVPILNVGVMFGVTVKVNDVVVAHCPVVGVNVYVPLV